MTELTEYAPAWEDEASSIARIVERLSVDAAATKPTIAADETAGDTPRALVDKSAPELPDEEHPRGATLHRYTVGFARKGIASFHSRSAEDNGIRSQPEGR